MDAKVTNVIVVDSHPIVREGLKQFLEEEGVCKVIAEAGDGPGTLAACDEHEHDVLLLNALVPGCNVLELISTYKTRHPENSVVTCYIAEDMSLLHEFKNSGTDGFIGQAAASGEYSAAVQTVIEGGNFFSKNLTDVIFKVNRAAYDRTNEYDLTVRELEILSLLANGFCNKEIANQFDLSIRTVETHRLNIRRKTSSNTLSDLVRVARSLGLSSLGGALHVEEVPLLGAPQHEETA